MNMTRARLLAAAAILALAGGCAILTQPTLYLLPIPTAGAPAEPGLSREVIALDPIVLPQHAQDTRIATRGPDGAVTQSLVNVWADPLTQSGSAALAVALEGRTGAPVLVEPLPIEASPTIRVAVVADRFIGALEGAVTLSGEIRVSDLRQNGLAIHRRFAILAPVRGAGYQALAQAHSDALAALADEIASALAARFGQ